MALRQFIKFTVGEQEFCVDIKLVREISKIQEMLRVPNAPRFIEGLINLRGTVLTIFNLRKRLDMQDQDFDENSKIIIVWVNNMQIGFTVDKVTEIIKVEDEFIDNTPPSLPGIDKKFLSGVVRVGENMILNLDLSKVLSPDEETELKEYVEKNKNKL